jgi:predicted DNA-binding ribbon-helix-helix protein
MSTKPKKRSLTLKGHRTSVSLEDKFWEEFSKIAERQNISINELASRLDVTRELNSISLASLIRDFVLNDLLQRLEKKKL